MYKSQLNKKNYAYDWFCYPKIKNTIVVLGEMLNKICRKLFYIIFFFVNFLNMYTNTKCLGPKHAYISQTDSKCFIEN